MTHEDFKKKYLNTFVDFDKRYGNQCVDLARQYIKDVLNLKQPAGVGGAKEMFDNFEKDKNLTSQFIKIKNNPLLIPKQGDIVIWNGKYGPYGHIAIIDNASLMSFVAISQNDPANSKVTLKKYSYNCVSGFLRKK